MARSKGIYKRKDSPYWWIEYTGPDGRRRQVSTKTNVKAEAEYLLSCRRKESMEGVIPSRNKKPALFSQLIKEYLSWTEHQKAFQSKRNRVNLLLTEFGDVPLTVFTTKALEQFQAKKLKECKKSQKEAKPDADKNEVPKFRKPATINRDLSVLKHMLKKAVEWQMVPEEVLKGIAKVGKLPENNRRLRYLSKEECGKLIEKCKDHVKPIVITALNTGMRRGEILSLTWDRIDLTHGFILLDVTKNGERREIPINATVRAQLEELAMRNVDGHRHVFHDKTGKPYLDVKRSFLKACSDAGITDFHFHDLRHTFASHLVMAGVDLTTVKELLGHKDITMTLRYAHLAPEHKAKAVEILVPKIGR